MNFDFLNNKLASIQKNVDFAERGKEIVKQGKVRLGPFASVEYQVDWQQDPLKNRTWQWRWGTLSLLTYLIAYHAQTSDAAALEMGRNLIRDWSRNFQHTKPFDAGLNEFVWHDHGTALRAEHILLFLAYIECRGGNRTSLSEKGAMLRLLEKHADALAQETFYSRHTNHGLEQARVLLLLSKVGEALWRDAKSWRAVALDRLRSEFDFSYTPEGVHVENSPAYHIFVFKVFLSIFQQYGFEELGDLADAVVEKSRLILDYITHVLRPDGLTPIIGDSEKLRPTDSFREALGDTEEYQGFKYVHSRGRQGVRPVSLFRVYPVSGYAIYRDRWAEARDYGNVVHAIFKGGPLSQYHRQEDEGHLVLYAYGEDWLIDAGMYNYNKNDPIRKYVRSREAHNVVVVDGAVYRKWDEIRSSWVLNEGRSVTGAGVVDFSFAGMQDLLTNRRIEFDGTEIKVRDTVRCLDARSRAAKVLWHVGQDKQVLVDDDRKGVTIRSRTSKRRMRIGVAANCNLDITVRSGVTNGVVNAVSSELANKFVPARVIEFICAPMVATNIETKISFD